MVGCALLFAQNFAFVEKIESVVSRTFPANSAFDWMELVGMVGALLFAKNFAFVEKIKSVVGCAFPANSVFDWMELVGMVGALVFAKNFALIIFALAPTTRAPV